MSTPPVQDIELSTGVRLQYVEDGEGTPVLMLHGYSDSWYSYAAVLAALGGRVHSFALTQRGHGDAERPSSSYELTDFAADAIAFLDARELESVVLVGHSMGSLIAQEVALAHPERISHLALIGSGPRGDNEVIAGLAEAVEALEDPVDRAFIHEFQASTLHRPIAQDTLDTIVAESAKMPARVWRHALVGLRAYDASARLPSLAIPTRLFWGECDTVFSRAEQDELASLIPGARLTVYPDVGHGLHWEQPQRFADELLAFIADRD